MSALGDGLVSFWLGVALVVVTLIGALGWAAAWQLGRDAYEAGKSRKRALLARDRSAQRLDELRRLSERLIARIRDVEPKGGKS